MEVTDVLSIDNATLKLAETDKRVSKITNMMFDKMGEIIKDLNSRNLLLYDELVGEATKQKNKMIINVSIAGSRKFKTNSKDIPFVELPIYYITASYYRPRQKEAIIILASNELADGKEIVLNYLKILTGFDINTKKYENCIGMANGEYLLTDNNTKDISNPTKNTAIYISQKYIKTPKVVEKYVAVNKKNDNSKASENIPAKTDSRVETSKVQGGAVVPKTKMSDIKKKKLINEAKMQRINNHNALNAEKKAFSSVYRNIKEILNNAEQKIDVFYTATATEEIISIQFMNGFISMSKLIKGTIDRSVRERSLSTIHNIDVVYCKRSNTMSIPNTVRINLMEELEKIEIDPQIVDVVAKIKGWK